MQRRTSLFLSTRPPAFHGGSDPFEGYEWIHDIERCLELMGEDCPDREKVSLAAFMLKSDARIWWDFTRSRILLPPAGEENINNITWEVFKWEFNNKYLAEHVTSELELDFNSLKQGDRTVGEYETEFMSLSRFVRPDSYSYQIRGWIVPFKLRTFRELVNRALKAERITSREEKRGRSGCHECMFCQGDHDDFDCPDKAGKCYSCGAAGHYKSDCPNNNY